MHKLLLSLLLATSLPRCASRVPGFGEVNEAHSSARLRENGRAHAVRHYERIILASCLLVILESYFITTIFLTTCNSGVSSRAK